MKTFVSDSDPVLPVMTFDLETVKVAGDWQWGSGETNSRRWVPIMCGVGRLNKRGVITVEVRTEMDERRMIDWIEKQFEDVEEAWYCSTNSFDKGVLNGTFINARRHPAGRPGAWPTLEAPDTRLMMFRPGSALPRMMLGPRPTESFGYSDIPRMVKAGKLDLLEEHCERDVMENLVALRGLQVASAPGFLAAYRGEEQRDESGNRIPDR